MRYFRLAEAERLLPQVEQYLRDALFHRAEYERVHGQIEAILSHVRMSGGARVNFSQQTELRTQRDGSMRGLQEAMTQIEQIGVLVKDLDIGLLDFMARYQDRDVCLCWKLGESEIRFWHGADEGFRARKEIDDNFRANHRGEALSSEASEDPPN